MEISDWQDAPRPISSKSSAESFVSPILLGVVGTLILHAFIVQSAYLGQLPLNKRMSDIQRPPQVAQPNESGDALVIVQLADVKAGGWVSLDDSFSQPLRKAMLNSFLDIDVPPLVNMPLALSDEEGSDAAGATADKKENARLYGIYTGQIRARIERVWRRPRTPVNETRNTGESFQCDVQIVQDVTGNVKEVMLPRCNGTAAWQRSLIGAIQQASPLPAPPGTGVFRSLITLNFVAFTYSTSAIDDEYEPHTYSASSAN